MTQVSNNYSELKTDTFRKVFDELYSKREDDCVLSFFGEIEPDKISEIIRKVEANLKHLEVNNNLTKKVFSVFVEGLQNMRMHGETDSKGYKMGFFILSTINDGFHISLGNLISNRNKDSIERKLIEISRLTRPRLKAYYLEVLTNGIISQKGGAGLGLITIALKATSPLRYSFQKVNNKLSSFTLELDIALKVSHDK